MYTHRWKTDRVWHIFHDFGLPHATPFGKWAAHHHFAIGVRSSMEMNEKLNDHCVQAKWQMICPILGNNGRHKLLGLCSRLESQIWYLQQSRCWVLETYLKWRRKCQSLVWSFKIVAGCFLTFAFKVCWNYLKNYSLPFSKNRDLLRAFGHPSVRLNGNTKFPGFPSHWIRPIRPEYWGDIQMPFYICFAQIFHQYANDKCTHQNIE